MTKITESHILLPLSHDARFSARAKQEATYLPTIISQKLKIDLISYLLNIFRVHHPNTHSTFHMEGNVARSTWRWIANIPQKHCQIWIPLDWRQFHWNRIIFRFRRYFLSLQHNRWIPVLLCSARLYFTDLVSTHQYRGYAFFLRCWMWLKKG